MEQGSKRLILKVIAGVLSLVFAAQDFAAAAVENPLPATFFSKRSAAIDLGMPAELGAVEESYSAGADSRTLFLVQDAHTNESCQTSIAHILKFLNRSRGVGRIFLEAGTGDDSLAALREKGSAAAREAVGRRWMRNGELKGAEYFDLTSELPLQLWGVEDKTLYLGSVSLYADIVRGREEFQKYLEGVDAAIRALEPRIYNPLLLAFDARRRNYHEGRMPATDYAAYLVRQAGFHGLSMKDYPHLDALKALKKKEDAIDFAAVNAEQAKLMASPPSEHAAYPELSRYADYLKDARAIDAKALLTELASLEGRLAEALAMTDDEDSLWAAARGREKLGLLFELKLTPKEFDEYRAAGERFSIGSMTGFLNRKIADLGADYENWSYLKEGFGGYAAKAERFYELTRERDEAFVRNAMQKMDADGSQNAVLIAGGYHSPNLKEILRRKGISFVSITPQTLKETNHARYEKILLERSRQWKAAHASSAAPADKNAELTLMETPQAAAKLAAEIAEWDALRGRSTDLTPANRKPDLKPDAAKLAEVPGSLDVRGFFDDAFRSTMWKFYDRRRIALDVPEGLLVEGRVIEPAESANLARSWQNLFWNILDEALKNAMQGRGGLARSHEGGPVTVTVRARHDEASGRLIAEVIDNGVGIPAEVISGAARTTKAGPGRTDRGLGLGFITEGTKRLGGTAEIETSPKGTTVRISVPARRAALSLDLSEEDGARLASPVRRPAEKPVFKEPITVAWDLDETLGWFRALRAGPGPVEVRIGAAEALARLKSRGARNVVTSAGRIGYVEEALRHEAADLARHFEEVFARDRVQGDAGSRKDYAPVLDQSSLNAEDAKARFIVVGNNELIDAPDLEGVVFIHIDDAPDRQVPAAVLEDLIDVLYERGAGNFNAGFKALYESAEPEEEDLFWRIFEMNGFEFQMQYKKIGSADFETPIIRNIRPVAAPEKADPADAARMATIDDAIRIISEHNIDLAGYIREHGDLAIYFLLMDLEDNHGLQGVVSPQTAPSRLDRSLPSGSVLKFKRGTTTVSNFRALRRTLTAAYQQGSLDRYSGLENLTRLVRDMGQEGINLGQLTTLISSPLKVSGVLGVSGTDPQVRDWRMPRVDLTFRQLQDIQEVLRDKYQSNALQSYGRADGRGLIQLLTEIAGASRDTALGRLKGIHLGHLTGLINSSRRISEILGISASDPQIRGWKVPYVNLTFRQFEDIRAVLMEKYQSGTLQNYGQEDGQGLVLLLAEMDRAADDTPLGRLKQINLSNLTSLINSAQKISGILGAAPADPQIEDWKMPQVDLTFRQFEDIRTVLRDKYQSGTLQNYGQEDGQGLVLLLAEIVRAPKDTALGRLKGIHLGPFTGLINSPQKISGILGIPLEDPQLQGWRLPKVDLTFRQFEDVQEVLKTKYESGTLQNYGQEGGEGLVLLLAEMAGADKDSALGRLNGINVGHLTGLIGSDRKVSGILGIPVTDAQLQGWAMPYINLSIQQFQDVQDILKAKYRNGTLAGYGQEDGRGLVRLLAEIAEAPKDTALGRLKGIHLGPLTSVISSPQRISGILGIPLTDPQIRDWKMPYVKKSWQDYQREGLAAARLAMKERQFNYVKNRALSLRPGESRHHHNPRSYDGVLSLSGLEPFSRQQAPFADLLGRIVEEKRVNGDAPAVWADVGPGHGIALRQAKKKFGNDLRTYGVDLVDWFEEAYRGHPDSMANFERSYGERTAGPENAYQFVQGSIETVVLPEAPDLISAIYILPYSEDPLKGLANLYNQLKPGGTMVLSLFRWLMPQPDIPIHLYSEQSWITVIVDEMKKSGIDADISGDVVRIRKPDARRLEIGLLHDPERSHRDGDDQVIVYYYPDPSRPLVQLAAAKLAERAEEGARLAGDTQEIPSQKAGLEAVLLEIADTLKAGERSEDFALFLQGQRPDIFYFNRPAKDRAEIWMRGRREPIVVVDGDLRQKLSESRQGGPSAKNLLAARGALALADTARLSLEQTFPDTGARAPLAHEISMDGLKELQDPGHFMAQARMLLVHIAAVRRTAAFKNDRFYVMSGLLPWQRELLEQQIGLMGMGPWVRFDGLEDFDGVVVRYVATDHLNARPPQDGRTLIVPVTGFEADSLLGWYGAFKVGGAFGAAFTPHYEARAIRFDRVNASVIPDNIVAHYRTRGQKPTRSILFDVVSGRPLAETEAGDLRALKDWSFYLPLAQRIPFAALIAAAKLATQQVGRAA